jgi:predicted HTH domain antitoxin
MMTLTLEFPENIFSALRCDMESLSKEVRLAAATTWYEQGKVSQEVAAQVAGMNRTDFLLALSRMGKDSFQVDLSDLGRELSRPVLDTAM